MAFQMNYIELAFLVFIVHFNICMYLLIKKHFDMYRTYVQVDKNLQQILTFLQLAYGRDMCSIPYTLVVSFILNLLKQLIKKLSKLCSVLVSLNNYELIIFSGLVKSTQIICGLCHQHLHYAAMDSHRSRVCLCYCLHTFSINDIHLLPFS